MMAADIFPKIPSHIFLSENIKIFEFVTSFTCPPDVTYIVKFFEHTQLQGMGLVDQETGL